MSLKKIKRLPIYLIKRFIKYFGSYNYRKYIIIGYPRTGSTLLATLMRSHPNIDVHEEVFRNLNNRTTNYIWDKVFCRKNYNVKYVGFKLFYRHPFDCDKKEVWDKIQNDSNIKIIHLKRKNILRTIVSKKITENTGIYTQTQCDKPLLLEDKKLVITKKDCIKIFDYIKRWQSYTEEKFKYHDILQVTYEDLNNNMDKTMIKIFNFLNIRPYSVKSELIKQNPESLLDLIYNYEELAIELKNTELSSFLDKRR